MSKDVTPEDLEKMGVLHKTKWRTWRIRECALIVNHNKEHQWDDQVEVIEIGAVRELEELKKMQLDGEYLLAIKEERDQLRKELEELRGKSGK